MESNIARLVIDSMAFGGKGVGRADNLVWFVERTLPGDEVEVRTVAKKKRYCEGELVKIINPSPLRHKAACAYFAACGGCQWQDVAYSVQLDWKVQFLRSALQRIGKLDGNILIEQHPSPEQFFYRSRVLLRLHVQSGRIAVGFFKRGARELVAIDSCQIAEPAINRFIAFLRNSNWSKCQDQKLRIEVQVIPFQQNQLEERDFAKNISDRLSDTNEIIAVVYPSDGQRDSMEGVINILRNYDLVRWAGSVFSLDESEWILFEKMASLDYFALPGQFHQVNYQHNLRLREIVKNLLKEICSTRILDLFCGSGNLSLPVARDVQYIEGVELNRRSIAAARKTVEVNKLTNCCYLAGDAVSHMWKVAKNGEQFDTVILDPPREGFYDGMPPLVRLAPNHIVYVSCDPNTLARDLGYLCRKGYQIKSVHALDFFPHTFHIEACVLLEKVFVVEA